MIEESYREIESTRPRVETLSTRVRVETLKSCPSVEIESIEL